MVLKPWTQISPREGISGFANPATITVLAMLIVCLALGLNARGAMELVGAALGLTIGILTPIYAVIALVAIVTSVMTPPLLRRALAHLPDDVPSRTA